MATVTIDTVEFTVYADVSTADDYLVGSITATAWRAADDDTKARALVSATRWIDAQSWQEAYDTVAERDAEPAFATATIELAALLVDDPDYRSSFQAADTKRLKAGSVEIEYFRGARIQTTTVFPKQIMTLIGRYLASAVGSSFGGALSYGTGRCTDFGDDDDFEFTQGL